MRPFRALVVPFLLSACGGSDAGPPATAVPHLTLAPDLSIGEMAGDDAVLFTRVAGTALDAEGRIWVADAGASELRAFAPDGTFLFTVGRQGAGPGEFSGPCCIAIDDAGRLWVRDGGNGRMMAFEVNDTAGREVASYRLVTNARNFWAATRFDAAGNVIQVAHRPGTASGPDQLLLHTDAAGTPIDSVRIPATPDDSTGIRVVTAGDARVFLYPPLGPLELVAHGPGGQYAKAVSSLYRVVWYDAAGNVLRVIERDDVEGARVTGEERAELEGQVIREAQRFGLSASERGAVPDRHTPLRALFFDDTGRLWAQRSTPPGAPREADVYDAEGALAFTVEWPDDVELRLPGRVGRDVALGISVDSLGVQRVVRLPIR